MKNFYFINVAQTATCVNNVSNDMVTYESYLMKRLIEHGKMLNIKAKEGIKSFYKYCGTDDSEVEALKARIVSLIDEGLTLDEESFRYIWQSGLYWKLKICKSTEGYNGFVQKYTELYGKPLEKDIIMYKAVERSRTAETINGGSWTKDIKSAFNFSAKYNLGKIFSMTIPKGTKTIHFHPTFVFCESEDVIDTTNVKNDTIREYATLDNLTFCRDKPICRAIFQKKDSGFKVFHSLSKQDSLIVLHKKLHAA